MNTRGPGLRSNIRTYSKSPEIQRKVREPRFVPVSWLKLREVIYELFNVNTIYLIKKHLGNSSIIE